MNCPQCGLYLPDANVERCPRCGWVRTAAGGATPMPGYNPWANPGAPSTPAEMPPQYLPPQGAPTAPGWPYYTPNTTSPEGFPTPPQSAPDQMSPYGQSSQQSMWPYGQAAQPSAPLYGQYGQAVPPSVPMYGQYGQQYGQYAPPSVPMYGQAAPPSMGQQPAWGSPFPPPPPQQKSNTGLIVTIVLVIVLLLGGGGGFLLLRGTALGQTGNTGGSGTATAPAKASNVVYHDSFTDPSSGWPSDSNCSYGSGGYHIKNSYYCPAPAGSFTNATVSVTVKQISGAVLDPYGIVFRISDQGRYEFDIDSNGKWIVLSCGGANCSRLQDYTSNAAIHSGLNATNTLSVAMQGSQFVLSINDTQVGQVTNSNYSTGEVGLNAHGNIEAAFTNFQVTVP